MRGYLKMWRTNLVSLIAIVVFVGLVVVLFHYRVEHTGRTLHPGHYRVPTVQTTP